MPGGKSLLEIRGARGGEIDFSSIAKDFAKLERDVGSRLLNRALKKGAVLSADRARAVAPRRSDGQLKRAGKYGRVRTPGHLQRSIKPKKVTREHAFTIAPRKAFYARFIEGGTRHIRGKAFFSKSWSRSKGDAWALINKTLRKNIAARMRREGWK